MRLRVPGDRTRRLLQRDIVDSSRLQLSARSLFADAFAPSSVRADVSAPRRHAARRVEAQLSVGAGAIVVRGRHACQMQGWIITITSERTPRFD